MSQEVHHDTHHHTSENAKSKVAMKSSFWFVIILVGLFIAALNFIGAMSSDSESPAKEKTEVTAPGSGAIEPGDKAAATGHTEIPAEHAADSAKH